MSIQYISLRDQGYGDSTDRLMAAGRQMFQQKLQSDEARRQQEAFALEQQQRQIANAIAATNAAAQPQQIQQRTELTQAQIDAANENLTQSRTMHPLQVQGAQLGIQHQQDQLAQDPIQLAIMQAHLKQAELANQPTDETAESSVDPLGNITETIKRTKGGQPFGSSSKIVRGNRPNAAKTNVVYYPETDPETGVTQRVPYTVGVDPAGNPVRQPLPVASQPGGEAADTGDITQAVLNKYFSPEGTPKQTGGFLGMWKHPATDNPSSLSDAQALSRLKANPALQKKLGIRLDPSENSLGESPSANPTQPSKPAVPAGGVSKSGAQGSASTGTPKTTPTKFDKLKVNDIFTQNGVQYVKTGPRSAKPLKDVQAQPTPQTMVDESLSAADVDNPAGP